jgi:NAD(P)-dependent dehydrogenase (short-subunit alcohol dehydrogenase family)
MSTPPKPVHLILGATGGIGSQLSRRLASQGAQLLLAARAPEPLEALGQELGASVVSLDAREPDAVEAAGKQALETYGSLHGIANCVGSLLLKPAHGTSPDEWDDVIGTNLRSAFAAVRAAARLMRKQGGAVALVSSAAARVGLANHEAIAAAKAGIEGLARSAAATYAPHGIRVNVVAPGLVRTPMTAGLMRSDAQEQASAKMHPLGRIGEPKEIAAALAWLLDAEQGWITGQVLGVDGGLATARGRS